MNTEQPIANVSASKLNIELDQRKYFRLMVLATLGIGVIGLIVIAVLFFVLGQNAQNTTPTITNNPTQIPVSNPVVSYPVSSPVSAPV